MRYVLCHPGEKRPIGTGWQRHSLTWEAARKRLATRPELNVGILLGPESGVWDVDCDGPAAEVVYQELFGNVKTPCWQARLGKHYLHKWDDRLAGLGAIQKGLGVECRLGTDGKGAQSICPPSICDGVKREWIIRPDECDPAPAPESVIEALCALREETAVDSSRDPMFATLHSELHDIDIKRLREYFERAGNPVIDETTKPNAQTYLALARCPRKVPDNIAGGRAAIVFPDGNHNYRCHHTECDKDRWPEIEEMYNPLDPVISFCCGKDFWPLVG